MARFGKATSHYMLASPNSGRAPTEDQASSGPTKPNPIAPDKACQRGLPVVLQQWTSLPDAALEALHPSWRPVTVDILVPKAVLTMVKR